MKNTDSPRVSQTKSYALPVLISGVIMLAIWAYLTITTIAPGWVHVLFTAGVFFVIYGIAARDTVVPKRPRD